MCFLPRNDWKLPVPSQEKLFGEMKPQILRCGNCCSSYKASLRGKKMQSVSSDRFFLLALKNISLVWLLLLGKCRASWAATAHRVT